MRGRIVYIRHTDRCTLNSLTASQALHERFKVILFNYFLKNEKKFHRIRANHLRKNVYRNQSQNACPAVNELNMAHVASSVPFETIRPMPVLSQTIKKSKKKIVARFLGPYPNHHQQHHQQPSPHHRHYNVQQKIYVSTNPFITTHTTSHYSPTSFGKESATYATLPPTTTTSK